jgi:hypothetical protein
MRRKTTTSGYFIVIDDAQYTEIHVLVIMVLTKAKGMCAFEPAKICTTAIRCRTPS